jgi:hypothetical protein
VGRECSTNEYNRNTYTILVVKAERKRPQGRPRHKWMYNIKTVVGELGWDGMNWIDLAENMDQWRALVNTVINFRVS